MHDKRTIDRQVAESASRSPAGLVIARQRAFLAMDLAELLTWLRGLMSPDEWTAVSQAMALLTGRSLEQRLSLTFSAVTALPTPTLTALLELFRDVGADLAAGRGHRPLTELERGALEELRAVLATV